MDRLLEHRDPGKQQLGRVVAMNLRVLICSEEHVAQPWVRELRRTCAEAVFRVTGVREYAKDKYPANTVYAPANYAALRLITCGGDFTQALIGSPNLLDSCGCREIETKAEGDYCANYERISYI